MMTMFSCLETAIIEEKLVLAIPTDLELHDFSKQNDHSLKREHHYFSVYFHPLMSPVSKYPYETLASLDFSGK